MLQTWCDVLERRLREGGDGEHDDPAGAMAMMMKRVQSSAAGDREAELRSWKDECEELSFRVEKVGSRVPRCRGCGVVHGPFPWLILRLFFMRCPMPCSPLFSWALNPVPSSPLLSCSAGKLCSMSRAPPCC